MSIPQIYLVEPYNAYAQKGKKKKHWMQEVEEQALLNRIIAEQTALQQAEQEAKLQAFIQEAKSRTLPPQAPADATPPIVGNTAGAGAGGAAGSAPGGGGTPTWDFWNPKGDIIDFSRSPASASAPATITYTNLTTTPQFDLYNWEFSDGATTWTSTDTNPVQVFQTGSTNPINFTASLQVSNSITLAPGGRTLDAYTLIRYPTVTAAFTFNTTSNVAPFSVSFVNGSSTTSQTPPALTYLWTFTYNNGTTATVSSSVGATAASRRIDSGSFTASLQATGSYNVATKATSMFLAPAPTLTAGFTFTTSSNFAPSNATFLSNNTYNGIGGLTYFWNLGSGSNFPSGDNSASIIPNPPNTYTASGSYTASYAITESLYGITSSYTQSFLLQQPILTISFSVNTGSGIAPQSTPFTAYVNYTGPGAVVGTWNFGELRENLNVWTTPYASPTGTSFTYETRSVTGQDGKFTASLSMTSSTSGITAFYTQSFNIVVPSTLTVAFITQSFGFGGAENSYMDPVSMSYSSSASESYNGRPDTLTYKWDFGSSSFYSEVNGTTTGTSTTVGPHFRSDYMQVDGVATPYTASLQVTGSYGLMGLYTQSFRVDS